MAAAVAARRRAAGEAGQAGPERGAPLRQGTEGGRRRGRGSTAGSWSGAARPLPRGPRGAGPGLGGPLSPRRAGAPAAGRLVPPVDPRCVRGGRAPAGERAREEPLESSAAAASGQPESWGGGDALAKENRLCRPSSSLEEPVSTIEGAAVVRGGLHQPPSPSLAGEQQDGCCGSRVGVSGALGPHLQLVPAPGERDHGELQLLWCLGLGGFPAPCIGRALGDGSCTEVVHGLSLIDSVVLERGLLSLR